MLHERDAFFLRKVLQAVCGGNRQLIGGGDLGQRFFLLGSWSLT
jgi:hypothetical protein